MSNAAKNVDTLATGSSVLHNYSTQFDLFTILISTKFQQLFWFVSS